MNIMFVYVNLICRQEMMLVHTIREGKILFGVFPLWLVILGMCIRVTCFIVYANILKFLLSCFKTRNIDCVYGNWLTNRFDGFTSTFQDKLFKGYNMEIHNQIFYTTLCSCVLSFTGENLICFWNLYC